MGEYHLPLGAERAARQRKWSRVKVDELLVDYFRSNQHVLADAPFADDMSRFFIEKAREEEIAEATITKSLLLEWCGPSKYRAIIFETNWQNVTTVLNIAESDTLSDLKRWFKKEYPDVRCVYLGSGDLREVRDVFLTASCLMMKTYEESNDS